MSLEVTVAVIVQDTVGEGGREQILVRTMRGETVIPVEADPESIDGLLDLTRASMDRLVGEAHHAAREQIGHIGDLIGRRR